MKKNIIRTIVLVLMLTLMGSSIAAFADTGYTYNYDYWGEMQYSPDSYAVKATLTYKELGLDKKLNGATSIFVFKNMLYVCDAGNDRVIEISINEDKYEVARVIDSFTGDTDEPLTFSSPRDIFVTDEYLYICDTGNGRVLKLTTDLEYVMSFVRPVDDLFDQSISFQPSRLVVDDAGRVYLVALHVNKGLVKYEPDGEFTGFVGATEVTYDWYQYIWKNYFMTKAQRAQTEDFVPTEYDNVALDKDGFMYVVTTHIDEGDLRNDQAKPVRKLNSLGSDILIKNGEYPPIGDVDWSDAAGFVGSSKFIDVTPLENDTYFCLDQTRGRIFGYDNQGHLLYAFGGNGNRDGYFRKPVSIDHFGTDLLVLDQTDGQITVFTPTEFGALIYQALDAYSLGDYDSSADYWREVLTLNGNYELAYIGIGRSLLRQDEYKEAMMYFETKMDEKNYAKAYKLYRKEWVEDHIVIIFTVILLVMIVPLAIGRVKKLKEEVAKYEEDCRAVENSKR